MCRDYSAGDTHKKIDYNPYRIVAYMFICLVEARENVRSCLQGPAELSGGTRADYASFGKK